MALFALVEGKSMLVLEARVQIIFIAHTPFYFQ